MESKINNPLKGINKIIFPVCCLPGKWNYFSVYQNQQFYMKNVLLVTCNQPEFKKHK